MLPIHPLNLSRYWITISYLIQNIFGNYFCCLSLLLKVGFDNITFDFWGKMEIKIYFRCNENYFMVAAYYNKYMLLPNKVYFTWYNAANTFRPKFITDLSWSIKCDLIIKKINFLVVSLSLHKSNEIYDIYWTAPTYHKCHQGFCYLFSWHVRLRPYLFFYYDRAMK